MNKILILFLIVFNLIYCENIALAIKDKNSEKEIIFNFIPNEKNTAKNFVNNIKN
jgi:hypothetical protein